MTFKKTGQGTASPSEVKVTISGLGANQNKLPSGCRLLSKSTCALVAWMVRCPPVVAAVRQQQGVSLGTTPLYLDSTVGKRGLQTDRQTGEIHT